MTKVNCKSWSHDGMAAGCGVCAKGLFGGRPSVGVCTKVCKEREEAWPVKDIIIRNWQGAGDAVQITAVIRDLHLAHPARFRVAVETWAQDLFLHSPYIAPRDQMPANLQPIKVEGFCPNDDQQHLLSGFNRALGEKLGLHIPLSRIGGDIHLSIEERKAPPRFPVPYWLVWAGGHMGMSTKWWNPAYHQRVVDHFKGRLLFVQMGAAEHWHERLSGAVDLVGKTTLRDTVSLMYHAGGVVSGISFGMHLAAAVPMPPGGRDRRPAVIIAGGRESIPLIQYPTQTVLHNIGQLHCCLGGACWKNKAHVAAGQTPDCLQPIKVRDDLTLPRCMTMIKPEQVIDAIEGYLAGEEDHRQHLEAEKKTGRARAKALLPICSRCDHHVSDGADGLYVRCRKARPCCGDRENGRVSLYAGQACPVGNFPGALANEVPVRVLQHG